MYRLLLRIVYILAWIIYYYLIVREISDLLDPRERRSPSISSDDEYLKRKWYGGDVEIDDTQMARPFSEPFDVSELSIFARTFDLMWIYLDARRFGIYIWFPILHAFPISSRTNVRVRLRQFAFAIGIISIVYVALRSYRTPICTCMNDNDRRAVVETNRYAELRFSFGKSQY